eukprot:10792444-Ditylum_brightwellii.AAC.1
MEGKEQQQQHLAVIGEFAKYPRYQGMGSSQLLPTKLDTAWDHMTSNYASISTMYAAGYSHKDDGTTVDTSLIDEAVRVAKLCKC